MIDVAKKQSDARVTFEYLVEAIKSGEALEVFAVAFDHRGNPMIYYSGNWHNLAKASAFLQGEFMRHAWDNEE